MGWAYVVKALVDNPAYNNEVRYYDDNTPPQPRYHYKTVYEGNDREEAIVAWEAAKATGSGCVILEDRSV